MGGLAEGMIVDDADDPDFVDEVRAVVRGLGRRDMPREVQVVKLDGWFGPRWLGFAYKTLGQLEVHHRGLLLVPPFVPARVRGQQLWCRDATGIYVEVPARPLHIAQRSEANAKRWMSDLCPEAAVIWWSGGTKAAQRGSLMAYLPTPEGHVGWYAGFARTDCWRVVDARKTSVPELVGLAVQGRETK